MADPIALVLYWKILKGQFSRQAHLSKRNQVFFSPLFFIVYGAINPRNRIVLFSFPRFLCTTSITSNSDEIIFNHRTVNLKRKFIQLFEQQRQTLSYSIAFYFSFSSSSFFLWVKQTPLFSALMILTIERQRARRLSSIY